MRILLLSLLIPVSGCAFLDKVRAKAPELVEYSREVLLCAQELQAQAALRGKALDEGAAIAFCAAFEAAPRLESSGGLM